MIVLDTSVLIDSFTGHKQLAPLLRHVIEVGERLVFPAVVLYEWLRGPRIPEELALQESILPREQAIPLGWEDAALSAKLYRSVSRPRGREIDLAIAACAIAREAPLWTVNRKDFQGIPMLRLYDAG
jgi:predicted nucleic acid-binding protein